MQGMAELVSRGRALHATLAERLPAEAAHQYTLALAVLDLARSVAVPSEAVAHPFDSAGASGTDLPHEWSAAYDAWRQCLESAPLRSDIDRHCAPMGAAEDRAYYAVELFLARFRADLRRTHGIYYTPRAVVDYLVTSVDRLLATQLDMPDGLLTLTNDAAGLAAVDPACGAGVFLACILRQVRDRLAAGERAEPLARAVRRVGGYELVPAAAQAARWLLAHEFKNDLPGSTASSAPAIVSIWPHSALHPDSREQLDELRAADAPLVIVGNPPYGTFGRANRDPWILELLRDYQTGLSERKHNLHDAAIKFLRWAQWQIDRAGRGVLALVINHAFMHGVTHRRLRESLQQTFQQLYLLDLNGSALRQTRHSIERDENIFGIRPGVALLLAVKDGSKRPCQVAHAELLGLRSEKLAELARRDVTNTTWTSVRSAAPAWRIVPPPRAASADAAYSSWWPLDDIFLEYTSGVQTKNDALFTDFARAPLATRIQAWLRERGQRATFDEQKLVPYMMAPWDLRWIYYDPQLLGRARYAVLRHFEQENVGLVFMRQSTNAHYDHALATRWLVSDRVFYSGHGAPFVAPLYQYEGDQQVVNLAPAWRAQLDERVGSASAWEAFAYIYAILQAPRYRSQFATYLNAAFPRIPLPERGESFRTLVELGQRLLACHLPTFLPPPIDSDAANWHIQPPYPRWRAADRTLWVSAESHFADVPPSAWSFRLGGYPILGRWLTKRRGRRLGAHERDYFAWLLETVRATQATADALDEACSRVLSV